MKALGVSHFINADLIAQDLSPLRVENTARAAGRLMLEQMELRLANGDDFALESTLDSCSLAPFIERCKDAGYRFTLIYIWLNSADLAVQRVAREAVADAIEMHRRMGRSIVVSRDGVVTRVRPHEITPRALPHERRKTSVKRASATASARATASRRAKSRD